MPFEIEHEGKKIKVWTQEEVDSEVKGLKVTNDNLKAEKQDVSEKLKEAKESVRQSEEATAKAQGDNAALTRIAEEREADKRQAVEDERKKFNDLMSTTKKEKVDNFITSILDGVQTVDDISRKHLRKLLRADYEFDYDFDKSEFTVTGDKVHNADDLKKVLSDGEEYRRYMAGSGATGGGATGGRPTGAGKKWSDMTEKEHVELYKRNPDEYRRLRQTAT
jgi:hypothetical protein